MKTSNWKNIRKFFPIIFLTVSCTTEQLKKEPDLYFPNEFVSFEKVDFFKNKHIIPLETQDSILIGAYPTLLLDKDFFIYSRYQGGEILSFDKNGKFKHSIGKIGSGPEEYIEPTDVCLDKEEKSVDVLALNTIYRYTYNGNFIEKIPIEYPAFSFHKENSKSYWLYIGNNQSYSSYKLFKIDKETNSVNKYLTSNTNILPISENNFHKCGAYTTFHESYSNNLYRINQDSLQQTHSISFKNLNFELSMIPKDPMKFISYQKQTHFAMVRCYLENKNYIYLQVLENIPNENNGNFYHWFINKHTQKNLVVKQNQNVPPDSYLYSPQILTENNELYFIGYPLEKEDDIANIEENPSVIIITISDI